MDYTKTKLSKYKTKEEVLAAKAVLVEAEKSVEAKPTVTAAKVEKLWAYLPWLGKTSYPTDKEEYRSFRKAAKESGLSVEQVKELWSEFNSVSSEEESI